MVVMIFPRSLPSVP